MQQQIQQQHHDRSVGHVSRNTARKWMERQPGNLAPDQYEREPQKAILNLTVYFEPYIAWVSFALIFTLALFVYF